MIHRFHPGRNLARRFAHGHGFGAPVGERRRRRRRRRRFGDVLGQVVIPFDRRVMRDMARGVGGGEETEGALGA